MFPHLASRGGWAFALLALVFFAVGPVRAACNSNNPKAIVTPAVLNNVAERNPNGTFATITLDGTKSTPGNPDLVFAWTFLDATPSSVTAPTLNNPSSPTPSFTSPNVPVGGASLRFELTVDCGGTKNSTIAIVNINDVVFNAPPTASFSIVPLNPTEGTTVTLDGTGSTDIDGDALTYSWQQIAGSPNVTLTPATPNGSKQTFVAPNVPVTTTFGFRLTVSDGALQHSQEKSVNVVWTNDPPIASLACPPGGVLTVDEGDTVTFDGSGSFDPDGSIATRAWSQDVGLPLLGIAGLTTPTVTFTAPHLGFNQLGAFVVTHTVEDNALPPASASAYCGLFITDVTAPVIVVPADITEEATSAGGAPVTYSATAQDAVEDFIPRAIACVDPSGSTFPLGAAPAKGFTSLVTCTASDARNNTASKTFNITVRDTTPPLLTVPAGLGLEATGPAGAVATFSATTVDVVDGNGFGTCVPASGSTFALGATSVACNASDARGNAAAQKTFVVNVFDSVAPIVHVPADITAEALSADGAPVTFSVTASDVVDQDVEATCSHDSGDVFPLGDTTVDCSATDDSGNTGSASFVVTVEDTTAPTLVVPANIVEEAEGAGGNIVEFTVTATDTVDPAPEIVCVPPSGSVFEITTTTVACTATDASGNAAQDTFTVTVQDTTPPALTIPGDATLEATGPAGAVHTFVASAFDVVSGSVGVSCAPASGSTFGLGTTTVDCSATDGAGNTATDSFTVKVQDTTAPALTLPANATLEATGPAGAVHTFVASAFDVVSGSVGVSCTPTSGSTFALGTTTVNCSATDGAGNTASGGFSVKVQDTTKPTLHLPADITAEATSSAGATVTYNATASDLVDPNVVADCTPVSGSTFAITGTTVDCSATDASGNTQTGSFQVTVRDTTAPVLTDMPDIVVFPSADSKAAVTWATPVATDIVDGNVTPVTCVEASGHVFGMGTTEVTCSATDAHGNTGTETFNVTLKYNVGGFYAPVDNPATVNTVTAGQAIPVKFSLGGYQGMQIFKAGYPKPVTMPCNGAAQDAVEETLTAGSSTLQYDAGTGRYHYVWKTEKSWAGTCRQLQLHFADDTVKVANFYFRK